ncbi:BTAD domain-containing putative transcriptional regulator [Actinomadura sp. 1N219]|uniref:AfsR/SARP family transcriptional regulator n=1 Tax=Actinomadura sp. 1N219 TaxID=3375152 RepID=UPI00379892A9
MPPDLPAPMPDVTVTVFNSIELRRAGRAVPLGGPTHRAVFGHLVILEGTWISRGELVGRVWAGREEPLSADDDLQRKAGDLRKVLDEAGLGGDLLTAVSRGYRLTLPRVADFQLFRDLREQAAGLARQDKGRAADLMQRALDLVEGTALPGVDGAKAESFRQRMAEERGEARRLIERWSLQDGRHRQRLPLLKQALAENPFDQEMAGYLMYALAGLGRNMDALNFYNETCARLRKEGLSVDPRLTEALTGIRNGAVEYGVPAPREPIEGDSGESESEEPTESKAQRNADQAAPEASHHYEFHRIDISEGGSAQFGLINNMKQ